MLKIKKGLFLLILMVCFTSYYASQLEPNKQSSKEENFYSFSGERGYRVDRTHGAIADVLEFIIKKPFSLLGFGNGKVLLKPGKELCGIVIYDEFYSGILEEKNLKNSESKFFKTKYAGLRVVSSNKKGYNKVGYDWYVECINDEEIDSVLFLKAILQNPKNEDNPIIYDGVYKKGSGRIIIRHLPLENLKFAEYSLKLQVYKSSKREKIVDELNQAIFSCLENVGNEFNLTEKFANREIEAAKMKVQKEKAYFYFE